MTRALVALGINISIVTELKSRHHMSDSKNDKKDDLTRIEDLSIFNHDDDDDSSDLFKTSLLDEDESSDPEIQLTPPINNETEVDDTDNDEVDFSDHDDEFQDDQESTEFTQEFQQEPFEDLQDQELKDQAHDMPFIQQEIDIEESQPVKISPVEIKKELTEFHDHLSYGILAEGSGPPFAIAIKNIKPYQEKNIIKHLEKLGVIQDNNRNDYLDSINTGSVLISQLSEYCAIYLYHQLRTYDLEMELGLVNEIQTPKSYSVDDNKGSPGKGFLNQNKKEISSSE